MDHADRMDTAAPGHSPASVDSPSSLTPLSAALALADSVQSPTPTGGYTDYILRSSAPTSSTGWRYNIMKFVTSGERTVDPSGDSFVRPVKLNRKDPRTVRRLTEEEREKINKAATANPDGMQVDGEEDVKDEDAKPARKEREEIDMSLVGTGTSGKAPAVRSKATMFKKKIKRVFVSSEEARRLKREEWMPWVLEDDEGNERWIGRLEGGTGESSSSGMPPPLKNASASTSGGINKGAQSGAKKNGTGVEGWRPPPGPSEAGGGGSSYVAFVFGKDGDDFKVVPANRWYKFNRGPRYATLGTEEAEDEYNRMQKSHEPERWMMHRRPGGSTFVPSASSSTSSAPTIPSKRSATPAGSADTKFKMLSRRTVEDLPSNPRSHLRVPGATLRSVLNKSEGRGGRRTGDAEQDDDEFDYNEEFQDDEEGIAKIDDMADEEETKQLEERIKKEMSGANGVRDLEEVDEEKAIEELTRPGREVKKLVKKIDKSAVYESDDEDNPYASSEEGSDDDDDDAASSTSRDAAAPRPSTGVPLSSRHQPRSSLPGTSSSSRRHSVSHSNHGSKSNSRHGSPIASGSALVAQRATSPSGTGRRSNPGSRSGSPAPSTTATKRKRSAGEQGEASSEESKRQKNDTASPPAGGAKSVGSPDGHLITESDLIAFFKSKPAFTSNTKDVLSHFKKAIRSDARNKSSIAGMLHAVANLVEGELVLKSGL